MAVYRTSVAIESPDIGGVGANVWHLRTSDTGPDQDQVNLLMQGLKGFYQDVAPVFPEDVTIRWDGSAQQILSAEPGLVEGATAWSVPGGTTSQGLPPANCLCITWRTSLSTRSGRGRTFLGPVAEEHVDAGGRPTTTIRTLLQSAAAEFIDSFDSIGAGAFAVFSPTDNVARDITGARIPTEFAVLRSRRD